MDPILQDASERASRYLASLPERRVAPDAAALAGLARLGGPLPEKPQDAHAVLALLDEAGSPATMATAGPRFFGFVVGGSLPATLAAHVLATAWDQNAYSSVLSPTAAAVEETALAWLVDVLRLPAGTGGAFVTGCTMASLCGLAAARHRVLERQGWDVESQGLVGAPPVRVVVGAEAHPSLFKALGLLGLGRDRVERVPVDDQGRMRADLLPELDDATIVCAQAGNVNTGAFDPLDEIGRRTRDAGAWLHVDGAFGLWAAAAPSRERLARGHDLADSWAVDAHKWLNVPYDSGIALTRDPDALRAATATTAAYLAQGDGRRDPSDFTPEMSRRARGVDVWAALASLGRAGVADLVERCCALTARFADGCRAAGFEVLNDVVLNQALVSFGPPEVTRRVVARVQADGTCWCGPTVWQGRTAMRVSVSSWATTERDVDRSVEAVVRAARAVGA